MQNQGLIRKEASEAPKTTRERIVFHWDISSKTFQTSSYSPSLTENSIQYRDIDRFIDSLKTSQYYDFEENSCGDCPIITFFFLTFIGIVPVFLIAVNSSFNMAFFPIIFFGYFGACFCLGFCCVTSIKGSDKEKVKSRGEEFRDLCDKYNEDFMEGRGWYWRVGHFGGWISLERGDYHGTHRDFDNPLLTAHHPDQPLISSNPNNRNNRPVFPPAIDQGHVLNTNYPSPPRDPGNKL